MAGFEYDYVTLLALLMLCKEFISISLAFPFGWAKTITIGYVWTLFCFFKMEKTVFVLKNIRIREQSYGHGFQRILLIPKMLGPKQSPFFEERVYFDSRITCISY